MRLAASCAAVVLALAASAAAPQEDREVTVRILSDRGTGVPGAWVRPVRQVGDVWFERTTNASGAVRVRTGELSRFGELCVGANGYYCLHVPVHRIHPAEGEGEITIRLKLACTRVVIHVKDALGVPLPHVRVVAKCAEPRKGRGRSAVPPVPPAPVERFADAAGVAEFLGLAPGRWEFDVAAPGLQRKTRTGCPVNEGPGPTHDLKLIVEAELRLRGVLIDNAGNPVPGATVRRLPRGEQKPHEELPAVSDADGRFSLRVGPTGDAWTFEVRLADGRVLEVPGISDTPDERKWVLDIPPLTGEGPSIRGRVVGAAGNGVRASVSARAVHADAAAKPLAEKGTRSDGTFEIYGLPAGPIRLGAFYLRPNGTFPRGSPGASIVVEAGSGEVVEVRIPAGEPISGRLVDREGRPASGVSLVARPRETPPSGSHGLPPEPPPGFPGGQVITEADGSFLLENLSPGTYEFTAAAPDASGALPWIAGGEAVAAGASGVLLSYGPDVPIRGRAMSPSEEPLEGVRVIARRLTDRVHLVEVRSGADGAFSLHGLDPEARYSCLLAFDDGSSGEAVEAAAGTADLPLFADPGVVLRVRILSADGRPLPERELFLHHGATGAGRRVVSDARGVAVLYRAQEGEHSLRSTRGEAWGVVRTGAGLQEVRIPEGKR